MNYTDCPFCKTKKSLALRCMGSKDGNERLPTQVYCYECLVEGPIIKIQYANKTEKVWKAFFEMVKS